VSKRLARHEAQAESLADAHQRAGARDQLAAQLRELRTSFAFERDELAVRIDGKEDALLFERFADVGNAECVIAVFAVARINQLAGEHPSTAVVVAALGPLQQEDFKPAAAGGGAHDHHGAASHGTAVEFTYVNKAYLRMDTPAKNGYPPSP